jgi:transketolase
VTLIQARTGSTRLPNKVMLDLAGKPLLIRMVERVQKAKLKGEIIVITTTEDADNLIVELCELNNIKVFRGHPTDLLDRHYEAAKSWQADVVLKIPSDCPLIDPMIIDEVIAKFLQTQDEYDYVSNLHPGSWPDGNDVEVMTFLALEEAWANAKLKKEREHTTPYIYENSDFFSVGNVSWSRKIDFSKSHRWTIDYQEDYLFIKQVFERLYPVKSDFGLEDILELLKQNPDIEGINRKYAGQYWWNANKQNHIVKDKLIEIEMKEQSTNQTKLTIQELNERALRVREHIVKMATDGGCFIGASLSCVDVLVFLYSNLLKINPLNPQDENRDFVFLSKGHDVPALYGTFAELGFINKDRLKNHLLASDHIYWHPNRNIPGVEFHSGSLGHLPSVGMGVAMDLKILQKENKVLVITGDGELNEGSVWEALLVASAHKLNNFTLVVDRNQFQANMATEDLIPLEDLTEKFKAFGCEVERINGHDFSEMEAAFSKLPFSKIKPSVIICDTIRGKGLPSIEAKADRWFVNFTHSEVHSLLDELHGNSTTILESETLMVR